MTVAVVENEEIMVPSSSPKIGEAGRGVQESKIHPLNPPNLGGEETAFDFRTSTFIDMCQ